MDLAFVTIIPVELYTHEKRARLEKTLKENKIITLPEPSNKTEAIYKELLPPETVFYEISVPGSDVTGAVFIETTLCLIMEKAIEVDFRDKPLDHLNRILKKRRDVHVDIIDGKDNFFKIAKDFISCFDGVNQCKDRNFFKYRINYAFSFYVMLSEDASDQQKIVCAKVLAEPSIIGNEDMTSINRQSLITDLNDLSGENLKKIENIDLLSSAQTFITWASIASIVRNKEDWHITKDLLAAMEVRVQSIWNKWLFVVFFDAVVELEGEEVLLFELGFEVYVPSVFAAVEVACDGPCLDGNLSCLEHFNLPFRLIKFDSW